MKSRGADGGWSRRWQPASRLRAPCGAARRRRSRRRRHRRRADRSRTKGGADIGDRAHTTLLAWPYPGREHLPQHVLGELERHAALPQVDTPIDAAYLVDGGVVVLAGDERSGRILSIVDERADHGTAGYARLIAALTVAGMYVFAGNDAGRDYGAGWEYHPPVGNGGGLERRRSDRGVLVVSACDLLEGGERTVAEVSEEILAARARRLISYPAGLPAAVLAAAY